MLKAGICGSFAVPAFVIFPLISPVFILIAIAIYFKESKGIQARVGSSILSDVVQGLISVLRGDDTQMYWASLW